MISKLFMNTIILWTSIFTFSHISYGKPHKTVRSYYKIEQKKLLIKALIGTVSPIPIYSTIVKNPGQWKRYKISKRIYQKLWAAKVLVENNSQDKKQKNRAEETLHKMLTELKDEVNKDQNRSDPIFFITEEQAKLNKKILNMSVMGLAKLLHNSDLKPSKAFIEPISKHLLLNEYSLRYKLRKISLDQSDKIVSIFEKESEILVH